MEIENYSVNELKNYRIKKRWRYDDDNVEYYYAQRRIPFFGWIYFDYERSGLSSITGPAVMVGMSLIFIFVNFLASYASNTIEHLVYSTPALLLLALIGLILWMKIPYGGKTDINKIKELIDKRIRYRNRKHGSDIIEVSIKVERAKKLKNIMK